MMVEAKIDKGFLFKEEVTPDNLAPALLLSHYPSSTELLGVSLGHAGCELHDKGKSSLVRLFNHCGVAAAKRTPMRGIDDRQLTIPRGFQWIQGRMPESLPATQAGLEGQPVAILSFQPHSYDEIESSILSPAATRARLQALRICFSNTAPGKFVSRWGTLGFRVAVVGQENVTMLRLFFNALSTPSGTALGLNTQLSLTSGDSPTLFITSQMPDEWIDDVRLRDAALGNSEEDHQLSNIFKGSSSHNLTWKELRPSLVNDEVLFWLVPCDSSTTHTGYVSPKALKQWAQGTGPLTLRNYKGAHDIPEAHDALLLEKALFTNGLLATAPIYCMPTSASKGTLVYVFPSKFGVDQGLRETYYTLSELDVILEAVVRQQLTELLGQPKVLSA